MKQRCEIWSRVVGYMRPVETWNDSKKAEYLDRSKFDLVFEQEKQSQTKL